MITFGDAANTFTDGIEPPTPGDQREVMDRQVRVAVRILTVADLANIASIIVTAVWMVPVGPFRTFWGVSMLLVITNSCRMWFPWLREHRRATTRRDLAVLTVDVMAGGVLYAVLAAHVVPQVDGARQVVLVSTLIGVIGAGAVALSTIRSIGLSWVVVTTGGLAIGFVRDGAPELPLELLQLGLYLTALTVGILYLSWSFEQRCRAERAAERGRELVTLVLDDFEGGARDWLWRTDPAGHLLAPSTRFVESSGRTPAELERRTFLDLVEEGTATEPEPEARRELREALAGEAAFRDIVVPVIVAGRRRWWSVSGVPRADHSWSGVGADVTERYEAEQEIRRLANFDALTGMANRHRFSAELQALTARRRAHQQIRLSIIDLDDFKAVNDTLGHPTGDQLLVEVAGRLRAAVAPDDTCARLGGDEFAVVSATDPAPATPDLATDPLLSVFSQPFQVEGTQLEIHGSIGHATIPDDAGDADELVMLADLALYSAKEAGRGQVRAFEPEMRAAAEARARTQQDLRQAIDDHAFELAFQPLVAPSGPVLAFEALARWHHPEHGWVSPASFIAVAEETGLIGPLGEQLLDQALAVAATLPDHIRIAVNVAPAQLVSTGFSSRFEAALQRHHVPPGRVDVEVTESAVVDRAARATILALRRFGTGVAIDDFGTGYSSFASLQDMPITQLKIDRAFVRRLDRPAGNRARAIVGAIVAVAEAAGLSCVAEGVETEEQRAIVTELGCIVQGYLEARPMPASEIDAYLRTKDPDPGPRPAGPTR